MRFVVLALAALLVAAAVAFAQDPRGPARSRRPTPTPAPTETPGPIVDTQPSVPPDFAAIDWHASRALGHPARARAPGPRRPAARSSARTSSPGTRSTTRSRTASGGAGAPTGSCAPCCRSSTTSGSSTTAPSASGSWTSRARTAGASARTSAGSGTRRTRTGSTPTSSIRARTTPSSAPVKPSQVDRELAQELVDRFVAAGAVKVFVGPHLNLKGPRKIVVPLIHHDDHLHVRIR